MSSYRSARIVVVAALMRDRLSLLYTQLTACSPFLQRQYFFVGLCFLVLRALVAFNIYCVLDASQIDQYYLYTLMLASIRVIIVPLVLVLFGL